MNKNIFTQNKPIAVQSDDVYQTDGTDTDYDGASILSDLSNVALELLDENLNDFDSAALRGYPFQSQFFLFDKGTFNYWFEPGQLEIPLSCLTAGKWKISLNEKNVQLANYSGNLIRGYNLICLDISSKNIIETSAFVIQVSDQSDSSLTETVIVLHKPAF